MSIADIFLLAVIAIFGFVLGGLFFISFFASEIEVEMPGGETLLLPEHEPAPRLPRGAE